MWHADQLCGDFAEGSGIIRGKESFDRRPGEKK